MSRLSYLRCDRYDGFPRVSGDEPLAAGVRAPISVFSPRERG